MAMHDRLQTLRDAPAPLPREKKIQETIEKTQTLYFSQEQLLSYGEFLWTQLQYTRKRWWVLQTALLLLACQIVPEIQDRYHRVRSVGVVGCMFVVVIIPELWRNRESESTQVEASCLYALRQIYAARITLFGIVDVTLMTLFILSLDQMGLALTEVMAHFLLPTTVTACICFSLLCGKQNWNAAVSMAACLVWSSTWWLLLMNEWVYLKIAPTVWTFLFVMALGYLFWAVRRTIRTTNQYWEVEFV